MGTAAEKEALRGDIERTHSTARDTLEREYVENRNNQEAVFHKDLADIEQARREALLAAGLNSDGSDPQGRPTG